MSSLGTSTVRRSRAAAMSSRLSARARRPAGSSSYSAAIRYCEPAASSRTDQWLTVQPMAACRATVRRAVTRAQEAGASTAPQLLRSSSATACGKSAQRRPNTSDPSSAFSRTRMASRTVSSDQRFGPRRARIDSMFIGNVLRRRGRQPSYGSRLLRRDVPIPLRNQLHSRGRRIADPRRRYLRAIDPGHP